MLLAEYDYDTDIAVQRKEAFDDGIAVGEKIGEERGISLGVQQNRLETAKIMLLKNISFEIISECTGLSVEEIEQL